MTTTKQDIDEAQEEICEVARLMRAAEHKLKLAQKRERDEESAELERRQKEAAPVLAAKVEQLRALLSECEQLATDNQLSFELDIGHHEYFNGASSEPMYGAPFSASQQGWRNSSDGCY